MKMLAYHSISQSGIFVFATEIELISWQMAYAKLPLFNQNRNNWVMRRLLIYVPKFHHGSFFVFKINEYSLLAFQIQSSKPINKIFQSQKEKTYFSLRWAHRLGGIIFSCWSLPATIPGWIPIDFAKEIISSSVMYEMFQNINSKKLIC